MIPFENIKYIGLFLNSKDSEFILKKFPPIFDEVSSDHITLYYRPTFNLDILDIGKEFEIVITGQVVNYNLGAQALYVQIPENLKSDSQIPHITISKRPNLPQIKDSKEIVDALTSGEIETFKNPLKLKVVFGYFDNKLNQIVTNL